MIPQRYHRVVFSFFMALLMSCIMSFIITVFNLGFANEIVSIWLKAWGFAFIVAFPTVMLVSPLVHRLTSWLIREQTH